VTPNSVDKIVGKYRISLLNVLRLLPNVMVFGELGVYSIELAIKSRMLNFW